jgi:hypothetical protein
MCTPENLRPLCECPHSPMNRVLRRLVPIVAAGGITYAVIEAGYLWLLIIGAWVALMAGVGYVRYCQLQARPIKIEGSRNNDGVRDVRGPGRVRDIDPR